MIFFISDLHLSPRSPGATALFLRFLADRARQAEALYILGDLFEAWIGDDDIDDPYHAQIVAALRAASDTGLKISFMHGNRDFLLGQRFAATAGIRLLPDPYDLALPEWSFVLSHGDALCLDDVDYLRFRAQVRSADWQQQFLAQPLAARRAVARQIRDASESRKQSGAPYADVDATAAREWLQAAQAPTLIHGHTHHPALHDLGVDTTGQALQRVVLSDWDLAATPPRADLLRLDTQGQLQRVAIT